MSTAPARVFLHVGTRKSGTTSLQHALVASRDVLAEHGVHLLHPDRDVVKRELMDPLRVLRDKGDPGPARVAVDALRRSIDADPAPVHLLSVETLAEMPREVTDLLVGALEGYEVHVVITARHWGLTVPSEWQQYVKSRVPTSYADFVTGIRDRDPDAAGFFARQDVADIVDRWGAHVDRERVHVVACPPRSRADGTLVELFCGVVGIDPSLLALAEGDFNTSLSLPQAELLRRINIALGDRLPLKHGRYARAVRGWVVRKGMRGQERSSIRLPAEFAAWAEQETRAQLDAVLERGIHLVGRPEDLLASSDAPTGPIEADADDLIRTAVETLAELADRHHTEVRRLKTRIARLEAQRDTARARTSKRR